MKTIVVAKYKEDISWMENLPPLWQNIVISKDGPEAVLPNVGREPHTFFWVMEMLARSKSVEDDEVFAFVQGNPFDHSPHLFEYMDRPFDEDFVWLSEHAYASFEDGRPAHAGLPVKQVCEEILGKKWPGVVTFYAGGQFMIKGRALKKYTPKQYASWQKAMEFDQNPWCMERLWGVLFKPEATQ
jgi:hypothetical protein